MVDCPYCPSAITHCEALSRFVLVLSDAVLVIVIDTPECLTVPNRHTPMWEFALNVCLSPY